MQTVENATWQEFRRLNANQWREIYYNVHVGAVPDDDPAHLDADRKLKAALYAKRVDVIARARAETWVIEVKQSAQASAIGQILVYPPLVQARCPEWAPLRPMIVAARCDPDVADAAARYGVEVFCPPFGFVAPRR